MPQHRYPADPADIDVLKEHIRFRNGRVALNRLLKAPMSEKIFNWDDPHESRRGVPNQKLVNLYEKWGFGGFGTIITGNILIDPKYPYEAGQGIISKENDSPIMRDWYAKLARAAKANHALALVQINHPGAWALTFYTDRRGHKHIISDGVENPMEFSANKLRTEIIDRCVYAAKLLSNCGFDGMEINSAFGNQFCQFLHPAMNQRTDEFGGSVENRARLHVEIYNAIRDQIPAASGFLIGLKLNSGDFQKDFNKRDMITLCEILDDVGYDFIEITGGSMEQAVKEAQQRASTKAREDFFLEFVETVTKTLNKAVVYITGAWQTSNKMVEAITLGITSGIGLARAAAAEPNLPRKLLTGVAHSVLNNKFAPSDYGTAKYAAHFQIKTMSKTGINHSNNPTSDLPDFTDETEAKHFSKYAAEYADFVKVDGKPDSYADVIHYKPLNS